MAQAALVLTGQNIGTVEAAFGITDNEASRILAYAMAAHPVKVNGVVDPAESIKEVARIAMHDLLQKVVAREKKVAKAAAEAEIADINATPVEE